MKLWLFRIERPLDRINIISTSMVVDSSQFSAQKLLLEREIVMVMLLITIPCCISIVYRQLFQFSCHFHTSVSWEHSCRAKNRTHHDLSMTHLLWPETHFTTDSWVHIIKILGVILLDFIEKLVVQSSHNFAHVTAGSLSWQGQNYGLGPVSI